MSVQPGEMLALLSGWLYEEFVYPPDDEREDAIRALPRPKLEHVARLLASELERKGREGWRCIDCHLDTYELGEDYMLRDEVWRDEARANLGMLCIGCLETRLGRQLTPADFADVPINGPDRDQSARLRDRLGYPPGEGAA